MEKAYECQICHYVYLESLGESLVNVEPGTTWEEIGEKFRCPHCHAEKKMFKEIVI
ncbi:rubredoxin [Pseudomonas citrulli]|uniref:rubredoxin n=1 Tax=Pseudomonas citrulli TaxID=3064347 RepID=UPI003AC58F05